MMKQTAKRCRVASRKLNESRNYCEAMMNSGRSSKLRYILGSYGWRYLVSLVTIKLKTKLGNHDLRLQG